VGGGGAGGEDWQEGVEKMVAVEAVQNISGEVELSRAEVERHSHYCCGGAAAPPHGVEACCL
jgi:hypothetical protein